MTNKEILEQAIHKAIDGEWHGEPIGGSQEWNELPQAVKDYAIHVLLNEGEGNGYMLVIFNHDFSKALWGEGRVCRSGHDMGKTIYCKDDDGQGYINSICGSESINLVAWQYHLQRMVLAENPIKYLGDNL